MRGITTGGYRTLRELHSIVDYGRFSPTADAIDPIFGPTSGSFYWSSTTKASNSAPWYVFFISGLVDGANKGDTAHVRAVRGGPK